MPKLSVNLFDGRPLLDIATYARRGPGGRDHLSPAEIAQISRTVRRVPEAVVKVLPKDSSNLASISRHVGYIGRYGDLELEMDDGERVSGNSIGRQLLEDWDLDLDEHRPRTHLAAALGRKPPKLVHKLMFSMPPGTRAEGVLAATRNFLREEFGLKHRYAFVLHTDEPHPHVHAVVKAVSEQGVRLNIRKGTLREWRAKFAHHLRAQGIEANATERAVRGQTRTNKLDGIYRASRRGASIHMQSRAERAAAEILRGLVAREASKSKMVETRRDVQRGWHAISRLLSETGRSELAVQATKFVEQMPPPRTDNERLVAELLEHWRESRRELQPTPR